MSVTVEKCLQAWTNSLRQMNVKANIVFLGDSLTYYGDFSSVFPGQVVCNLGLRGDTIEGMIERVGQVSRLVPDIVYLMAGINDVAVVSVDEFGNRYDELVTSLIEKVVGAEIIVQKLLPVNDESFIISCTNEQIIKCNEMVSSVASKHHLKCIDLFSLYERCGALPKEYTYDGLHLYQGAYYKWINLLRNNPDTVNVTSDLSIENSMVK